jgi:EmrB/QacA subfamily drug resistance transporter
MSEMSLAQSKDTPGLTGNKNVVLFIICLLAISIPFMGLALNVALPSISHEFKADAVLLNWIVGAYALGIAIFSVPFGRIADIAGLKRVFILGMVILILASITIVIANSALFLIIIRFVQGIGGAMITSTSMALLTTFYPGKQRGKALGIYTAFVYAGGSIGPLIGGIITEHLSWRYIFLVPLPVGLLALILSFVKIKGDWAAGKGEKFDYTGSLIYGISLAAIMYGFSSLPDLTGAIITFIGAAGIIGFLVYENRLISPILNVALFKNNRTFVFSNLAALINYTATSAITFLISLYLQYNKGFSAETAGFILVAQPVVQTILSPFAGRLSDKVETRIVASIGMTMVCIGLVVFAFITQTTPVGLIIANLMLLGAGFALFSSPNMNAIMSSVNPKYYAVASSVPGTMRTIGQTLSIGICMIIMATVIGRVVISPENYGVFLSSVKIAFWIFALLCFCGIFASLARGKSSKN